MAEVLLILLVTGVALGLPGVVLVLKNMSMVSDALSHTILLGIVLAYFVTRDLNSPILVFGAAAFGVFTVFCIERLSGKAKLSADAATGLVFPLFFSVGVLLISRFAGGAHLDLDNVIMGDVVFAPFNRVTILGVSVPKALVGMSFTLIVNLAFLLIFYKEIKLHCFDPELSRLTRLWPGALTQVFIFLLSLSAVTAFEVVGAVLVIAFLVIPAATAMLMTKRFSRMLLVTAALSAAYAFIGYRLAMRLNVSIAGMCAVTAGLGFFLVFFQRRDGYAAKWIRRKIWAKKLQDQAFLLHVFHHRGSSEEGYELGFDTLHAHLNWPETKVSRVEKKLRAAGLLCRDDQSGVYSLTELGAARCRELIESYGLVSWKL